MDLEKNYRFLPKENSDILWSNCQAVCKIILNEEKDVIEKCKKSERLKMHLSIFLPEMYYDFKNEHLNIQEFIFTYK